MAETPAGNNTEAPKEPEYIDAWELLDQIAAAGPGASLKVRVKDLETGETNVSWAKWGWENLGPSVVHWKDPRDHSWADRILLLGGHTKSNNFPIKALGTNGRMMRPENVRDHNPPPRNVPITEVAKKRKFELLDPKDGLTPEELADIAKLEVES